MGYKKKLIFPFSSKKGLFQVTTYKPFFLPGSFNKQGRRIQTPLSLLGELDSAITRLLEKELCLGLVWQIINI